MINVVVAIWVRGRHYGLDRSTLYTATNLQMLEAEHGELGRRSGFDALLHPNPPIPNPVHSKPGAIVADGCGARHDALLHT